MNDEHTRPEPTEEQADDQAQAEPREIEDEDDLADEMSKESFPSSDPPSTWAGEQ